MRNILRVAIVGFAFAAVTLSAASKPAKLSPALARAKTATTAVVAPGDSVPYIWDANAPEQNVTGYKFYERVGTEYNLLGTVTTTAFTVANIAAGDHNYVVTAYRDADSTESGYSNEVLEHVKAPLPPLTNPTNLKKSPPPGIANISARAQVGVGENVLIGGVIITGQTTPIIFRAIGPSLFGAGIAGPLIDPVLELHDSNGAIVASNDDFEGSVGALDPSDRRESVISAALEPGAYTAVVKGKNQTGGVALVEIYRDDRQFAAL